MAVIQMFSGETHVSISEAEALVLKREAEAQLLNHARERFVATPQPDAGETYAMLGAADAYGACSRSELQFHRESVGDAPENAEVVFTDHAMKWMEKLRDEVRASLEEARGTAEINSEWTPRDTFLLLVLDGIFDR